VSIKTRYNTNNTAHTIQTMVTSVFNALFLRVIYHIFRYRDDLQRPPCQMQLPSKPLPRKGGRLAHKRKTQEKRWRPEKKD
jgi:hypothetical protein